MSPEEVTPEGGNDGRNLELLASEAERLVEKLDELEREKTVLLAIIQSKIVGPASAGEDYDRGLVDNCTEVFKQLNEHIEQIRQRILEVGERLG